MTDEIIAFVRAVQLRNISAAARSLSLSPGAASHRILQLENRIGARLLNRTTRNLQLTEEGHLFYEHALDVLTAVERAESSVASASNTPSGALRITAPLAFGRRILAPLISDFQEQFPKIQVRLRLSDHVIDMLTESVDIAIRMVNPADSSLIVRKLDECPRVLCAAPSYLDLHGSPEQPADLLTHNCLVLRFPGSPEARWQFMDKDGPVSMHVSGSCEADDGDVLTTWALAGKGIVMKPYWEVAEHLRSGALRIVMPDHPPEAVKLVMLYPHRQFLSAKVKAFIDFALKRDTLIEQPRSLETLRPIREAVAA